MIPVDFPGGIDILPGTQTEPVAPGAFRLVTDNGTPSVTTDGVTFTDLATAATPGSVPLTNLAHQADQTVVGNVSGGSASPVALTPTQLTTLVQSASASLPGAMPANLFSQAQYGAVFETPVIDLTALSTTSFVMPSLAGAYGLAIRSLGFLITCTGTQTTAPTVSIGNESSTFANMLAAGPATTATANGHTPALFFATTGVLAQQLLDLSNVIKLNVSVAAVGTGGYTATAKFVIQLALVTLT